MLAWAALSLTLAVVSALLGFGGYGLAAAEICQALSVVFLALFLVALIAHGAQQPPTPEDRTGPRQR